MICLVFLDMESNTLNSQGPFKWEWTLVKDLKLVEALIEYLYEREDNPENKFKLGYLKVLEENISTKLPNVGLRAKPSIESRLKTLKKLSSLPLFK